MSVLLKNGAISSRTRWELPRTLMTEGRVAMVESNGVMSVDKELVKRRRGFTDSQTRFLECLRTQGPKGRFMAHPPLVFFLNRLPPFSTSSLPASK